MGGLAIFLARCACGRNLAGHLSFRCAAHCGEADCAPSAACGWCSLFRANPEIPPAEGRSDPAGVRPIAPSVHSSRLGDGVPSEGEHLSSRPVICAWCKKQISPGNPALLATHGICRPCDRQARLEAGIPEGA